MRIGYDALLLTPPYSGVQVAVEETARALAGLLGPELVVFVPQGYAARAGRQLPAELREAGVTGRNRLARIFWEQMRLAAAARREWVELLHAPAYVMPLRWRGPSVLSVHDLLVFSHPEWCKRLNVWHFRMVMPPSLRQASCVVAHSETVAQELRAFRGVREDRIRVIPLGVQAGFAPASQAEQERVRELHGLSGPYVLTVGNLEPKKNLLGTLRVFRRLLAEFPHQLAVSGAPGWGDCRAWRALLEELPPERVKLLGYVAQGDLPALYSGADLYLQLSLYEGFGLPPLEAMACGTAAVVSNRGALPEISGPAAAVVDPAEETGCGRVIGALLADSESRERLAAQGRAHAAGFTWESHARQLVQLYREVLGHE